MCHTDALIIDPFKTIIKVNGYYFKKIFNERYPSYCATVLANKEQTLIQLIPEGHDALMKIVSNNTFGQIIYTSSHSQEQVKMILDYFNLPSRRNLYRFTLGERDRKTEITFRDICMNYELEPGRCTFCSPFAVYRDDAASYGFHAVGLDGLIDLAESE